MNANLLPVKLSRPQSPPRIQPDRRPACCFTSVFGPMGKTTSTAAGE